MPVFDKECPPLLSATLVLHVELSLTFFFFERHNNSWVSLPPLIRPPSSLSLPTPLFLVFCCTVVFDRIAHQAKSVSPCICLVAPSGPQTPQSPQTRGEPGLWRHRGRGRVEGTHNCLLRKCIFTSFCSPHWPFWVPPPLSARATRPPALSPSFCILWWGPQIIIQHSPLYCAPLKATSAA